jgi:hypothetical protein
MLVDVISQHAEIPMAVSMIIGSYVIPPRHLELQLWFTRQNIKVRNNMWAALESEFIRSRWIYQVSALKQAIEAVCSKKIYGLQTLRYGDMLQGTSLRYVERYPSDPLVDILYLPTKFFYMTEEHVLFLLNLKLHFAFESRESAGYNSSAWMIWYRTAKTKKPYWYLSKHPRTLWNLRIPGLMAPDLDSNESTDYSE